MRQVAVDERGVGQRLDNFLGRILGNVPRSHIFRVIRKGEVRVNGKRAKPETRLLANDMVRVPPVKTGASAPPRRAPGALVSGVTGAIVHEDAQLLVINKPAGVAVHGGSGVSFGVIEALRGAPQRGLNHAPDRSISGLLLVSRKPAALRTLHAAAPDWSKALSRAGEGQVGTRQETHRCAAAHRHSCGRRAPVKHRLRQGQ